MSGPRGLEKLVFWASPWPRRSFFRGANSCSALAGGGVGKRPGFGPYLWVWRARSYAAFFYAGEEAGPAPGGAARHHSDGCVRWNSGPALRATGVYSSAGTFVGIFLFAFCFLHTFSAFPR